MKLTPLERAAIKWWEGQRPLRYSEAEHLANPLVNLTSYRIEEDLAVAVAELVKRRNAERLK